MQHTWLVSPEKGRFHTAVRHPNRLPGAILRRLLPNSRRYGLPWVLLPDGSVTFREEGFVAATSPSMLLARHNFELARIHCELSDRQFTRSLEIGCGFGRLSTAIAQHSDLHTAIDINEDAVQAARVTYPSIDYQFVEARQLPFPDNSFDLVVTWTVLQHIRPEEIEAACAGILRVLTSDGLLMICEETSNPAGSGGHTWHRNVRDYERLFAPLRPLRHGVITEIAAIPGMESPGEVMVFQR